MDIKWQYNVGFKYVIVIHEDLHYCGVLINYIFSICNLWLADFEMKVEGAHYRPATITVMIGENGCGKTLLLELIAGRFRDRLTAGSKCFSS